MPKAGTVGRWLELPLSTDRFATEARCYKAECRGPHVAHRLGTRLPTAPRGATDTYLGLHTGEAARSTVRGRPAPMLYRGLARRGTVRLRQRLQRRTPPYLGPVRRSPLQGRTGRLLRVPSLMSRWPSPPSCASPSRWPTPPSSGPAHGSPAPGAAPGRFSEKHVLATSAQSPLATSVRGVCFKAALPADSTSARTGCWAFLSFLEVTLGLQPSMRYHGARTRPRPTGRRQATALRFPDSQDLPVSIPLTMQITMHVASSGSVPSDRGGRREVTYQRSGDRWATFSHQGWVEGLTGSKSRHQVTKSQGAAKHSCQA